MSKSVKIGIGLASVLSVLIMLPFLLYLFVIPQIVSNPNFILYLQDSMKDELGADLIITNPKIMTSLKPVINFKTDEISISKNGKNLLNIKNLDSSVDVRDILQKKIILKKLGSDDIYVDVNSLMELSTKPQKEQKPSDWRVDWVESLLFIKKCMILYKSDKNVNIKVLARNLEITASKNPKYIHFGILFEINHKNEFLKLGFKDKNNVYIKDKKLIIDNFEFVVNGSKVYVNSVSKNNKNYDLSISSNKFKIDNVVKFMNSNLIIPNGDVIMSNFNGMSGDFNFNFKFNQKGISGIVKPNIIKAKLVPLANIPLTLTKGLIQIDDKNIELKDFEGFYANNKLNKVKSQGIVKDYTKTVNTQVGLVGYATNDLAKYISRIAGCNFTLKGNSEMYMQIGMKNNLTLDIKGLFKIPKGKDFLIEGASISPNKFDRALGFKMSVNGDNLNIENLNYYISEKISKKSKFNKPMISIVGNINCMTGVIRNLGFDIPEPLPSEFFNVLIGQRVFRRGNVSGKLEYINAKKPYLKGEMNLADVRIVGQRFSIKKGHLTTNNGTVHLTANGKFRRVNYDFDGDIKNEMIFPIIVKNINLNIDEIDIERVLQTFAQKPKTNVQRVKRVTTPENANVKYFEMDESKNVNEEGSEDEPIAFVPNLIEIKKCNFYVKKGIYKKINFGNLKANLTLTRQGILEIKSNKFDFADGISTLKVYCNMQKQKYSVRLGAKDVDSDAIATSTLNLNKEIMGKASALLEFYTDENMKLNGSIKFAIKEGSITKLGLVQYILNMAALFRNPVAMISPSTLVDLVNVPDGDFKSINGELKIQDNIVKRINIKSSSPQLSAFIIGRINLENMDSSLRIYTKFSNKNNGLAGFLRNVSLNSLAKKVPLGPQEEVSYYAAELSQLPKLEVGEDIAQVFLTKVDGDIQTTNFLSSLKKIK